MKTFEKIEKSGRLREIITVCGSYAAIIRLPDSGTASVVWDTNDGYEHVSVSPKHKFRTPTWEDMCFLKDVFFDDEEECYQIHPPKSRYVNLCKNCLHIWRRRDGKSLLDENN